MDGFCLCFALMIKTIGGRVSYYLFSRIWKFEFLANFWNFLALTLKIKSIVLDGFFLYLTHMITSIRGCVAYNDLWPWPISSRSFDLDFENCVRSVTFLVLDQLFPYLTQIITTIRGCVTCDDLWPWPISVILPWLWKLCPLCKVFCSRSIIFLIWDPIWLNSVGNHEAAGLSSERRRSSCSSYFYI